MRRESLPTPGGAAKEVSFVCENFIGTPGMRITSPDSRVIDTTMSRASTCGSESAWAKSFTGPHGILAARRRSSHRAVGCLTNSRAIAASMSALALSRAGWRAYSASRSSGSGSI